MGNFCCIEYSNECLLELFNQPNSHPLTAHNLSTFDQHIVEIGALPRLVAPLLIPLSFIDWREHSGGDGVNITLVWLKWGAFADGW
jgi:hypothetical protein